MFLAVKRLINTIESTILNLEIKNLKFKIKKSSSKSTRAHLTMVVERLFDRFD